MIKKILIVFSLLLMFYAHNVLAHGGGHGPVSKATAMAIALNTASQFSDFDSGIGFGKLDNSWKTLGAESSNIHVDGNGYYIVSVENKQESKTLYILMSESGSVYDANFTGKFPKVN